MKPRVRATRRRAGCRIGAEAGSKLMAFEQRIGELTVAHLTINKAQVRADVRYILDEAPISP